MARLKQGIKLKYTKNKNAKYNAKSTRYTYKKSTPNNEYRYSYKQKRITSTKKYAYK